VPGARGEFGRSLEAIEAKVIELFAMITEDLPRAAHALEGAGGEAARVLAGRERVIDALYLEVEHLASRQVLLQAPVAADLRFLLSVLRVTPELERSHDLVMQVADRAGLAAPGGGLSPRARDVAARMADLAAGCGARRPPPGSRRYGRPASSSGKRRAVLRGRPAWCSRGHICR
jgi:phosphate transport system protein